LGEKEMIENLSKIGLALLISALVGLEREYQNKSAGLRTCMLVCLGSVLFTIIGLEFINQANLDMTRLLYAPIIGIGFLGSGVILKHKGNIEGITTASVLWALVATGLLCGLGKFFLSVISGLCIYLILMLKYIKIKINLANKKRKRRKNANPSL
jgi:putative Mg2+ transporter-C (MgtC) family protein